MTGSVYIIEAENGRIKIGYTGGPARGRARGIQTGNACKTRLVATIPARLEQEKSLHAMLDQYHAWGEWYDFPPHIDAYIRSLFGIGIDSIPDWSEQVRETKRTVSERFSKLALARSASKHPRSTAIPPRRATASAMSGCGSGSIALASSPTERRGTAGESF